MTPDGLVQARDAFARKAWRESHEAFAEECRAGRLEPGDYRLHAITAHLLGETQQCRELLSLGYREALRLGDSSLAARFAFWLSSRLGLEGAQSQSLGWRARGGQLIAKLEKECVEAGYFTYYDGMFSFESGDCNQAKNSFLEVLSIADRFGDASLRAIGTFGLGRSLVRLGDIDEGMSRLDEVIVAVSLGEISPLLIGDVYCGVLEACHEVFELRRAREWTGTLSVWCEGQSDLITYRGPCMVHRAEIMQFDGAWNDALDEALRACQWLSGPESPEGPGGAFYRLGELKRLRGEMAEAEDCYVRATRFGRRPEPGRALLAMAQGQAQQARASILRALAEDPGGPAEHAQLLDADVQVALALHDAPAARTAATRLKAITSSHSTPALEAWATRAEGVAFLLEGASEQATGPLRRAWGEWQRLDAPYEAACTRVVLGRAYRDLGDHDAAAMEFDAAKWVFQQLGAAPDLARLETLAAGESGGQTDGVLTTREREVLELLAAGRTNKEIGVALVISEHTVARHVQNMLGKLGFTSRTALASYAVENGLATPGTTQS